MVSLCWFHIRVTSYLQAFCATLEENKVILLYPFLVKKGDWRNDLLTVQHWRTLFFMNFFVVVVVYTAMLSYRKQNKAVQHNIKFHQNDVLTYTPRNTWIWVYFSSKGRLFLIKQLVNRHVTMSLSIWSMWVFIKRAKNIRFVERFVMYVLVESILNSS